MNRLQRQYLIHLASEWGPYVADSTSPTAQGGPMANQWEGGTGNAFIDAGVVDQVEIWALLIRQFKLFVWMGGRGIQGKFYQSKKNRPIIELGQLVQDFYDELE